MKRHIRCYPIVLLFIFTLILGVINYKPGTWLTGWDNLHPEFDFFINIKRSLFAVWQEYQGVGLLGGMGHATALPRELLLLILSLIFPTQILRYIWTIGMLGFGAIGTYMLLRRYVLPAFGVRIVDAHIRISALIGAIFYLTNIATVQMFHVPYEAFSAHFGYLPWLVYGFLLILERPTKKRALFFIGMNILSATQAYVPTLFVVYSVVLGIISIVFLFSHRTCHAFIHVVLGWAIIVLTNAYWMLPFSYFTITRSHVNVNAKINQMATEEVYLRNKAYGTLHHTIQLKGFWFDTFDFDPQKGQTTPLLSAWQTHSDQPIVIVGAYIVFILAMFGGAMIIVHRRHRLLWIVFAVLTSMTMLTTDTPPFSWINDLLRTTIPLLNQAFRFPFTKWSIVNAWLYSLLLAISFLYILLLVHRSAIVRRLVVIIVSGILVIQSFPIISGNLFYEPMQQHIPSYYFDLFSYLRNKPMGRIANLPQPSYWGWTYYRWGYTGSGFPWYGIEHPILDRAFDPWSAENENYYWELSYALYSKDIQRLNAVFEKYDIRYILFDDSVISPFHARALFSEEIERLLSEDPRISLDKQFGPVVLYERRSPTDSFIGISTAKLPNVLPVYQWTDIDQAMADVGVYKSSESDAFDLYYPFRSLFTKRSIHDRSISIQEDSDDIMIRSSISPSIQPFLNNAAFRASIIEPDAMTVFLNKSSSLVYDSDADPSTPIRSQNVIPCGSGTQGVFRTYDSSDGKSISFESTGRRLCLNIGVQDLYHRDGYVVAVESRHIEGRRLLFSVINQTAKHSELEAYLPDNSEWTISYFIIPPLASDGLGYTMYFSNDSIGRATTKNELRRIRVYKIPYWDMIQFRVGSNELSSIQSPVRVFHPNPSYYHVVLPFDASTLILYQSFHSGWRAYEAKSSLAKMFPFLFGKPLKNHVLINNWANGWEIPPSSEPRTIVIFFLPQLLQWIGFALLPVPLLFVFLLRK